MDTLGDETARVKCLDSLTSVVVGGRRREVVEDLIEEFEGKFVEHGG